MSGKKAKAARRLAAENCASTDAEHGNAFSSRIPYSATSEQPVEDVSTFSDPHDSANVRGGDPLGSPPQGPATGLSALPVSRSHQKDGRGPLDVVSTPEQIAEAKAFSSDWTSKESDGQKQYAQSRSTVFSFMQYREHPDIGGVLWTREQWDELITACDEAGILDRHAAIWHDLDKYPDGRLKELHFHGVIRLLPGFEKQVRFLAIRASLPASRIHTPKASYSEGRVVTGPLAADLAFYDFCAYLVHEDERSRDKGKHQYGRDEVFGNFDISAFLDAGRPAKAKRAGRAKMTDVDKLAMRIREEGLTLDEAEVSDPLAFNKNEARMMRARSKFLASLPQPQHRINFYLHGDGGTGKDALARALARTLVPGEWVPGEKEPFFVVGADNVEFEGYDGEPVVIFEEATAASLVGQLGRRNVFRYLNPFPSKTRMNVKNASTMPVNTITIITGPDDYETFLDGLAGKYVDARGAQHQAENPRQSYRRFPFIIPVRSDSFSLMVNKGFVDGTDEFMEYYAYEHFRQNMREVLRRVKGIEPVERRIETQLKIEAKQVAPIKDQFEMVVSAVSSEGEDPDALIAEFAELGEQLSASEFEEKMFAEFVSQQGLNYPEVLEHLRAHHAHGYATHRVHDFIHSDGKFLWCRSGHDLMELCAVSASRISGSI